MTSVAADRSVLEAIAPIARDGHVGAGFLRQAPGDGPFPAVVMLHPGMTTLPTAVLEGFARGATASRFAAAGYVVLVTTYRSRDVDPHTQTSIADCLAAVEYSRALASVDPRSVVVFGCSGGGDLALEVAAATDVCAIACEEAASMMFTGVFHKDFPRQGPVLTPMDSIPIGHDPLRFYTAEYQSITRAKIARIKCPVLLMQGNPSLASDFGSRVTGAFNEQVLIPELRAAGVDLKVVTYSRQPHCFCFSGGDPYPFPIPDLPDSYPAVARAAYRDVDNFFRTHLATQPAGSS